MADTPQEKTYPLSYIIGSLLAGLLVGSLIAFAWFFTDPSSNKGITETRNGGTNSTGAIPDGTSTNGTISNEPPTQPETVSSTTSGKLSIADQPAGVTVQVAHAEVSQDQWVVVHEERSGEPGNVLGAARFMPGTISGVVTLLRGTTVGSRYFGVIYQDDGDRIFSLEKDTPLHDAQGNTILVTFTAK